MFNLISHQPDIEQIYLHAKDPYGGKCWLLINKWESTGLKCLNYSKTFIEYSIDTDDIYTNIEEYNLIQYRKNLKTNHDNW